MHTLNIIHAIFTVSFKQEFWLNNIFMEWNSVLDSKLPGDLTFIFHHLYEILLMKNSEIWFKFYAEQSTSINLKVDVYDIYICIKIYIYKFVYIYILFIAFKSS